MASNNEAKAIAIDLGTTSCRVAVWQNNRVEIIRNEQSQITAPSYVAFTDIELLIGDDAKNQADVNPENTIFDVKRLIGRRFSETWVQKDLKHKIVSGPGDKPMIVVEHKGKEEQYTAEYISSLLLKKMKEAEYINNLEWIGFVRIGLKLVSCERVSPFSSFWVVL